MMNENLNALGQLLGCYFHQDWPDEYESDQAALLAIVREEPKEQVMAGLKEIDQLLAVPRSEIDFRMIMVDKVGCYFDPASQGMTYGDWLRKVREVFSGANM